LLSQSLVSCDAKIAKNKNRQNRHAWEIMHDIALAYNISWMQNENNSATFIFEKVSSSSL